MTELLSPFKKRNTLLQILLCALVFIGMAIPFKVMVLIEGLTEVRPVNAVPVVAGLMFGPAGAWGCAIGNLISDLFGTFSKASVLGFAGNFIAAYLPFKLWHILNRSEAPNAKSLKSIGLYIFISAIASISTGIFITCGLDIFFGQWSQELFIIICLNDFIFPVFLGLPVLIVLTCEDNKICAFMPQSQVKYKKLINLCAMMSVTLAVAIMVLLYMGFSMSGSLLTLISGIVFLVSVVGLIIL